MKCTGPYAEQIRDLFQIHCRKNGLNLEKLELSVTEFRRPEKSPEHGDRLRLF